MDAPTATQGIGLLCATAASVGFLHTIFGPDHYVPFVAMARIGRWSLVRTVVITLACGVGHVLSSVVLGVVGIAVGVAVLGLETIEATRGSIAAWLLLAFGLALLVWGLHRAYRNKPHTHLHAHADGDVHEHEHTHANEHTHVHAAPKAPGGLSPRAPAGLSPPPPADASPPGKTRAAAMTPWILFTIFLFGPCEPLIPIVMYPAAQGSVWGVVLVTLIFGAVTLATMTTVVVLACLGTTRLSLGRFERYGHAAAGLAITACAVLMLIGF